MTRQRVPDSPSVLCFDATGTLIELRDSAGDVYQQVALEHGVRLPAWRLEDALQRVLRHAPPVGTQGTDVESRKAGEFAWWTERIRQTFQAADSTVRFEDFPRFAQALFETFGSGDRWQIRDGIPEMLRALKHRGHPMIVVSNFDHRLSKILQSLEIDGFFDDVLLPADVGAAKPERPLFALAADRLGVPLEGLTYIGDDDEATLAAIAVHGPRTLHIDAIEAHSSLPDPIESAAAGVSAVPSQSVPSE